MAGRTVPALLLATVLSACWTGGGDPVVDSGADPDADPVPDPEVDEVTVCESCPDDQVCISSVRGRLLLEDGTPATGVMSIVKVHLGVCYYLETDEMGYFEVQKGCFVVDEPFFIEVPSIPAIDDGRVRYVAEIFPTQEQISDEGPDDFELDLGTHYWWAKPAPTRSYTPEEGATVDESGVQFEIPPGALGTEPLDVGVFRFPLEEWIPPFIANPFSTATVAHADGLYYLSPYWQQVVGEGLVLTIDPPEGWTDVDTGTLYILGDWVWYYLELPGIGEVPVGEVVELGPITYEGGKLVTPPVPILGWLILVKD